MSNEKKPPAFGPERKPDAVKIPLVYKGKASGGDLDEACKADFAPLLGCKRVDRGWQGDHHFITPFPRNGAVLQFNHGHPRAGESCYEWAEQGEGSGIFYGFLVDGAAEHFRKG